MIESLTYLVRLQKLDLVEAVALLDDDGVRVLAASTVSLGLGLAVGQHVLQAGQGHLNVKLHILPLSHSHSEISVPFIRKLIMFTCTILASITVRRSQRGGMQPWSTR